MFSFRPLHLSIWPTLVLQQTTSLWGKRYAFVIIDDYSRFTLVLFLSPKLKQLLNLLKRCQKIQNEKGLTIFKVRSDNGEEFEIKEFEHFYDQRGFEHDFSKPRTPQHNGVVQRKILIFKEWQERCLMKTINPSIFGEKLSTPNAISSKVFYLDFVPRNLISPKWTPEWKETKHRLC